MPSPADSDDDRSLLFAVPGGPREASRPVACQKTQVTLQAQSVSRMAHLDFAAALARVAGGDRPALERLYGASSVKLYGIVQRILGRQDWADAVLEDVYVGVWQHAGEFDGARVSPDAWLARLARTLALDELRRTASGSPQELPSWYEEAGGARQSEALRRLSACLNALPSEGRKIVLLAYHYGLTREEISKRVGWPVAMVRSSLRGSLAQLKECLGQ
jgi:RNA polymerase sigma-70 factor, ECF subfamily